MLRRSLREQRMLVGSLAIITAAGVLAAFTAGLGSAVVLAGWLVVDGERHPAAHSVGINETFQAVPRLVESHILDRDDIDLYDKIVTLEFIDFIRPAAKFNGVEDLVEEINRDLVKVRTALKI
jgi:riboflavin kinase/FMN adenylyltransferase